MCALFAVCSGANARAHNIACLPICATELEIEGSGRLEYTESTYVEEGASQWDVRRGK